MRRNLPVAFSLLMLVLSACQGRNAEALAAGEPSPTPKVLPTAEPTPNALADGDNCLACHIDKEQLISTAKPEEVVEEESKGVG